MISSICAVTSGVKLACRIGSFLWTSAPRSISLVECRPDGEGFLQGASLHGPVR